MYAYFTQIFFKIVFLEIFKLIIRVSVYTHLIIVGFYPTCKIIEKNILEFLF